MQGVQRAAVAGGFEVLKYFGGFCWAKCFPRAYLDPLRNRRPSLGTSFLRFWGFYALMFFFCQEKLFFFFVFFVWQTRALPPGLCSFGLAFRKAFALAVGSALWKPSCGGYLLGLWGIQGFSKNDFMAKAPTVWPLEKPAAAFSKASRLELKASPTYSQTLKKLSFTKPHPKYPDQSTRNTLDFEKKKKTRESTAHHEYALLLSPF